MKGPKRDTQQKAAPAARRSAEGPVTSSRLKKPARKEKAHAPVAAAPVRPRKLKPTPPVTDCLKCQKLATLARENTRLLKRIDQLEQMERARVAAAIAGGPVAISDEQLQEAIHAAYAPAFAEVLAVPVTVALSPAEDAGDRLKAVQMIVERMAGKVTDKVEHSGSIAGVSLVCDFPVAGGPTPADAPDPESGD